MPREIWNEGRVVGYSSYEIYVKQHLSEDPDTPPATEREWLASSIAMGSSMLLKVPNVSAGPKDHHYVDIFLPTTSKLAAANTIVAQFFDGEGYFENDSNWASRITDYGQLISNTSTLSPNGVVGSTGIVPTYPEPLQDWSDLKKTQLKEYMRVFDGIVIQPGTWDTSDVQPPEKDFQANLGSVYARVRLHIRGQIQNSPLILLTGFTIKSVLMGITGTDTSLDTGAPEDGDFLGPAVFPWASKIVFSVPNSYITYFDGGSYDRTIEAPTSEGSAQTKLVQDKAVIDMQATKPETFYGAEYSTTYYSMFSKDTTNPKYAYTVNEFQTLGEAPADGEAVLTVYQKKAIYPPALYGTFVGEAGEHYLNPLDVVAPGTVKIFYNKTEQDLASYENTFPGTTGMNKTSDGKIQVLNQYNKIVDVAGISAPLFTITSPRGDLDGSGGTQVNVRVLQVNTGKYSGLALALHDTIGQGDPTTGQPVTPNALTVSKDPTASTIITLTDVNSHDNISWSALLDALNNNISIDLLGDRLKETKYSLIRGHSNQAGPYINFGPDDDKIRLYISDTAPETSDVPEGSIGIGWGLNY